jgi:hypothetical protein
MIIPLSARSSVWIIEISDKMSRCQVMGKKWKVSTQSPSYHIGESPETQMKEGTGCGTAFREFY